MEHPHEKIELPNNNNNNKRIDNYGVQSTSLFSSLFLNPNHIIIYVKSCVLCLQDDYEKLVSHLRHIRYESTVSSIISG